MNGMSKGLLRVVGICALALLLAVPAIAETQLTIGAIGKTSDTYMLAVGWSNVLKSGGSDVALTPLEGGGTVKLLRGLVTNKWDIGFIGSPHYENALEGTLKFKDDPAKLRELYKDVRVLFGITSGMGQYVTRADSGITSIQELKGKKISIGRPGGMAGTVTQKLFDAEGVSLQKKEFSAQYLDYASALDEMRNKRLDATLLWGGMPQTAAYNFSRQIPVRFLPIDEQAFEAFKKEMPQGKYYVLREFSPEELKAVYGEGVDQDAPASFWTFQMMTIVRADMPEDVAYEITRQFWENLDTIKETGAALKKLNPSDALEALSGEIHPGALKYYKEQGWL